MYVTMKTSKKIDCGFIPSTFQAIADLRIKLYLNEAISLESQETRYVRTNLHLTNFGSSYFQLKNKLGEGFMIVNEGFQQIDESKPLGVLLKNSREFKIQIQRKEIIGYLIMTPFK